MSIQTIIRTFVAVSGLSLSLAGASWAEEFAENDPGAESSDMNSDKSTDESAIHAAPPAAADEAAGDDEKASATATHDATRD